jgi:hypothetical protein
LGKFSTGTQVDLGKSLGSTNLTLLTRHTCETQIYTKRFCKSTTGKKRFKNWLLMILKCMGEGELDELIKEFDKRCKFIVSAKYSMDDLNLCYIRKAELYIWSEDIGWYQDIPYTIPLCNEPVHGIDKWQLCPGDETLLIRLRRNKCEEPFKVDIIKYWFDADGTKRKEIIDKLVLDAKKALELLDRVGGSKERDVNKLLNELKVAIGLQPSG